MEGLFLTLLLTIAGFIIGLGAVTVIDLHGFLGRTSAYWTQATIRTHKVTKPLIWIGIVLLSIGCYRLFAPLGWGMEMQMVSGVIALLVLNGCFLSFYVSPFLLNREVQKQDRKLLPASLQRAIAASFVVSFVGWWGLLLFIIHFLTNGLVV